MSTLDGWWPGFLADHARVRDRLVGAYSGELRSYHDTQHLLEMFTRIDELLVGLPDVDRDAVRLAAWFHDAVYETGVNAVGSNEERSAVLARRELAAAGAPRETVEEVARLVRLTATHRAASDDLAGQVLCDADLAILAAPEQRYSEYAAAIRTEYAAVPDADFAAGRSAILRDLLTGDTVFHTEHAREHWEAAARANVGTELRRLAETTGPTDRIRALCLALPEVTEKASHGEASWFCRKQFVMMADHHHDDRLAFWAAAPEGGQGEWVALDPERFFVPPYVGGRGWVGVRLDVPLDPSEAEAHWVDVAEIVEDAWRHVAPATLRHR